MILISYSTVQSTMDCARDLLSSETQLQSSGAVKAVVLAQRQLAGRGQRGRVWDSPGNGNLYATALMTWPQLNESTAPIIGLLAGAAAADCICEVHLRCGGHTSALANLGLKWPNDIVIGQLKTAGVLTEVYRTPRDTCFVAVGFGANLTSLPEAVDIAGRSTSLLANEIRHLAPAEQVLWFARSLNRLVRQCEQFGIAAIIRRWTRWDASIGRRYTAQSSAGMVTGVANGLGPSGELSLLLDNGSTLLVTSASSLTSD